MTSCSFASEGDVTWQPFLKKETKKSNPLTTLLYGSI